MSAPTVTFETGHEEMIHDAQMDYYGKRLATASSDRSIRIFELQGDRQLLSATIKGHEGPVWQLSWAHPKFGPILASCSYDGRVCVWKEAQQGQWIKIYENYRPDSSVNSIQFAPHTYGLILAAGAADGTVTIYTRKENNTWDVNTWQAHKGGVNAVSWGPDVKTGALVAPAAQVNGLKYDRRLVTGGCDCTLRIWRQNEETGVWEEQNCWQTQEHSHSDWIRDVSWAPSIGLPTNTIASAGEDKQVKIWNEDASGLFKIAKILHFETKIWKVSWSVMGNILAVSQGDNKVSLWKESVDGEWKQLAHGNEMNGDIAAALTS